MYLDDIATFVIGSVGIVCFILLAGFAEGGNFVGAIVCLIMMAIMFGVAVKLDNQSKRKR